jgi:hypothetical protein
MVAPSVGGGVIELDVVAFDGSFPPRAVPAAAADAGVAASAGAGADPGAAITDSTFAAGVAVVVAEVAAPATNSAVLPVDDVVDDVTTPAGEVEVEVEVTPAV